MVIGRRTDLTPSPGVGVSAGLTDALSAAAGYALNEKADATRRAYRSDLRHFAAWCETVRAAALPAQPATVAGYLASMADSGLKASSIMRRAAAIAYAHKLGGFEPPINESGGPRGRARRPPRRRSWRSSRASCPTRWPASATGR